jgi:ADP-ribose pyrophosphatase|tara:strand:- start:1158 stop:1700 length:543 start_codon:yes stop_codon:yes gene_type:complete
MTDLKESRITTEVVYKGDFLDVRRDEVLLPNGETGTREWINHPGAVVIIPILPNGEIALIKQFRYAARSEFLELPAGKLDEGEDPKACAFRELEEEIGYRAGKMQFIANIHPAIGFANEIMSIYLAEDLKKTNYNRDKDEFIELIPTNMEEALNLVWENKITDVKSIIGLLWLKRTKSNN